MAKPKPGKSTRRQAEDALREEAARLALGTRKPNQTDADTRLIARGIEKGIALYKQQQRDKARKQRKSERAQRRERAALLQAGDIGSAPVNPRRAWSLLAGVVLAIALALSALWFDYRQIHPAVVGSSAAPAFETQAGVRLWHGRASRLEVNCAADTWRRVFLGARSAQRSLTAAQRSSLCDR